MGELGGLITLSVFLIIFLMMSIVALWVYNKDSSSIYLLTIRKKYINWRKIGRWWMWIQGFLLVNKLLGNEALPWTMTFGFPLLLITILVFYYFFMLRLDGDSERLQTEEFKEFDKSYKRDQKINKILD